MALMSSALPSEVLRAFALDSTQDATLVVVGSGLVCHWVFRRWEPIKPLSVACLLILSPLVLSVLFLRLASVLGAILLSFAIYLSTLLTSIVLYRISPFHPLAKYPGPIIARTTALWMAYIASKRKRQYYVQQLHHQYGDIVRIGPNELSIRDPSAIMPLMGSTGTPKGPGMTGRIMHQSVPPLIALTDPIEHARRRKPWNRAFSSTSLREYQPIIAKRTAQLVDALQHQLGGSVDLAQWISFFTYDFMGDMAFGGGTEMLRDGDKDGMWRLLKQGLRIAVAYEHVPWLSYYTKDLPGVGKDLIQLRRLAFERTAQRYQNGSTTKDLFYYLSNEDNSEKVSPPRELVLSDGVLAIIAGSDTTATTLSNVFYSLLSHPEAYRRLQEEVDKYYPPGEDALTPKQHASMPYLEAVINETMRLFPAVPSGSIRVAARGSGGKTFGRHFIPEGTQIRIPIYSVHRDPRNFSNPTLFWPERWLIAEGIVPFQAPPHAETFSFVHNPNAFIPFSFGPSNCVGKNLALLEMRMLICHTIQKLEMRFANGWDSGEWLTKLEDVFVTGMGQLPVTITRRD